MLDYPFTTLLVVKLALVVSGWVIGGTSDKGALESAATALFYVIIITWVTR